jgi:hypothetical protein
MTTIAARASTGEIAADSMVSGDDSFYLVEKLRKGKASIYGACGDWDKILKFYQVLESGGDLDSDTDVTVLELRNDGIWIYEGTIIPARIKNDFWAVGTGANWCMGALAAGASLMKAMEIACNYDTSSRGPIDYMKLGGVRGRKKSIG